MYNHLLGKAFAYHGRGPDSYDCLGLAIEVHKLNGIIMPDIQSSENVNIIHASILEHKGLYEKVNTHGHMVIGLFQLVPRFVTHMGVFIDDYGNFIHITETTNVTIENVNSVIWSRKIRGYYKWKL